MAKRCKEIMLETNYNTVTQGRQLDCLNFIGRKIQNRFVNRFLKNPSDISHFNRCYYLIIPVRLMLNGVSKF